MNHPLRRTASVAAAVLLLAGIAAGCGSKGSSSGSSSQGGIKVGPGVTDKTIKLGILTDESGVFAAFGIPQTQAQKLYWKQQNAKGGVCGRQVSLTVDDHGYVVQKAVSEYQSLRTSVLALQSMLGSPETAALLPSLKSDNMPTMATTWAANLLADNGVFEVGAPYQVEMINGLDYLKSKGKLKAGAKIGDIYFEGDYGASGLAGVQYWASKNGMTVVPQKIADTDLDMTAQVTALKSAGVAAVAMTTGPKQLASFAGLAASQGFNVPILTQNPAYHPAVLASPAAKAIEANTIVVSPVAPFNAPAASANSQAFTAAYGKSPNQNAVVTLAFAQGEVMNDILTQACKNKDLTRAGVINAAHQLSNVDTAGLVAGPLNYSSVGQPPTRMDYLAKPANVPGGLEQIGQAVESPTAQSWPVTG